MAAALGALGERRQAVVPAALEGRKRVAELGVREAGKAVEEADLVA